MDYTQLCFTLQSFTSQRCIYDVRTTDTRIQPTATPGATTRRSCPCPPWRFSSSEQLQQLQQQQQQPVILLLWVYCDAPVLVHLGASPSEQLRQLRRRRQQLLLWDILKNNYNNYYDDNNNNYYCCYYYGRVYRRTTALALLWSKFSDSMKCTATSRSRSGSL